MLNKQQVNEAFELLFKLETVLAEIARDVDVTHFDLNCEAIRDELCELNEE